MKDIINFIKARRKFYLLMLIGTVVFTLYMSFMNVNVFVYSSFTEMLQNGVTKEALEEYLTTGATELQLGYDNGELLKECFFDAMPELVLTCLLMAVLMFLTFWGVEGKKQKEFIEMLPCKRVTKELAIFIPQFIVLMVNCLVGIISTMVQITWKNKAILDLQKQFPELLKGKISETLIADANKSFLSQAALIVLFLVGVFLVYYLFSMMFKNRYAGIIVGVVVNSLWELSIWSTIELFGIYLEPQQFDLVDNIVLINPICRYHYEPEHLSLHAVISFCILYILILIAMFMFCKYTEHSKGKLCFFKWGEICFVAFIGLLTACILDTFSFSLYLDYLLIGDTLLVHVMKILCVGCGIFCSIILYRGMYHQKRHILKVEVKKEKSNRKNNFFFGRNGYFIVMVILSILAVITQFNAYMPVRYEILNFRKGYVGSEVIGYICKKFDIFAAYVNYEEQMSILGMICFCVIVYKCFNMYLKGKKSALYFMETLPVKRNAQFLVELAQTFLLGFIPHTVSFVCILLHLAASYSIIGTDAWSLLPGLFLWYGIGICFLVGVIGVLFFIDVVIVGRIFKIICLICSGIFVGSISVIFTELIFYGKIGFSEQAFRIIGAVLILSLGVVMLIGAYVLNQKRDYSADKFYFKFAAYGFTLIVTLQFVIALFAGYTAMEHYVFFPVLIVGTACVFLLTANWCIPDVHDALNKIGKKEKKKF